MRALVLQKYNDLAGIKVCELPIPRPGPDEILVKMTAAPINPSDLIYLKGANPTPRPLPSVPGFEGAGTVVATGKKVKKFLGKNVSCRAIPGRDGTWAEYFVTTPDRCAVLGARTSLVQASMLLINPLTAYGLIHFAKLEKHRSAIQTAAASAAGQMMVRWAKKKKFDLINVVRREEQVMLLKKMGAKHVLSTDDPDFALKLGELAKKLGTKVAFDAVAGTLSETILKAMPMGSELWSYGALSGERCQIDSMILVYQNKSVKGMLLPPKMIALGPKKFASICKEIEKNLSSVFFSRVQREFSMEEIQSALSLYQEGMTNGKCILRMDSRRTI